eukprot:TRINITY_DN37945_c0_g1_i2.p8 TRINITY_DN37945_c0_g1~~TRINITY_DN37945_c0_g1_i2.p8  ORF type:complete len:148 (+),score=13.51 TRINITY_DN37945_c0_g1_i2:476-919(+)
MLLEPCYLQQEVLYFYHPSIPLLAALGVSLQEASFFLVGACVNVVQIVEAGSILSMQLLNATAICFVVGSVMFAVASIPYLWKLDGSHIQDTLFTYVAWQYIVGSILFFLGGLFNFYRAFTVAAAIPEPEKENEKVLVNKQVGKEYD